MALESDLFESAISNNFGNIIKFVMSINARCNNCRTEAKRFLRSLAKTTRENADREVI